MKLVFILKKERHGREVEHFKGGKNRILFFGGLGFYEVETFVRSKIKRG